MGRASTPRCHAEAKPAASFDYQVGIPPSNLSRRMLRLRFECRKRLHRWIDFARRAITPPGVSSFRQYVGARGELRRSRFSGWNSDGAEIPDLLAASLIPSVAGQNPAEQVIAEVDQDGFAFALHPADAELFGGREQKLPRLRYELRIVVRNGRVCMRKRFTRPRLRNGLRAWFWGLLGYHFFTETAALLRLRGVPFVPMLREVDRSTRTLWMDFIHADDMKKLVAQSGMPIHDLHLTDGGALKPDVHKLQTEAQIESFRQSFAQYRPEVVESVREMGRRGVFPLDIKLGNVLIGKNSGHLYWVDFERAHLSFGRPAAELVDAQHREINRWFGTDMVTSATIRDLASRHAVYSPVDFGRLGYVGDISNVETGDGRWNWLLSGLARWPGKRVLDLGSNNCIYAFREVMSGAREVHCVEREPQAVDQALLVQRALEQFNGRSLRAVRIHQSDIADFLAHSDFPDDYFDITHALCSIYYLDEERIREAMSTIARISKCCWLQGNIWTEREDPELTRRSSPQFLGRQLFDAGFTKITLIAPPGYHRPLLIGEKAGASQSQAERNGRRAGLGPESPLAAARLVRAAG